MSGGILRWCLALSVLGSCSVIVDLAERSESVDAGESSGRDARVEERVDGGSGTGTRPDADPASDSACSQILEDGTCVINCSTSGCDGDIQCPAGRPCLVNCIGDVACENAGIDCSAATRCSITCQGKDACDTGGIVCGGTTCQVACVGSAACEEGLIDCQASQCNIQCQGSNACRAGVCCSGDECGGQCSASDGASCSCPL